MLRKDFIQRQFEEFGKVLAKILRFKMDKDWQKFESEIAGAVNSFTGMELKNLEAMTIDEFDYEIIKPENLSADQIKILARLMFEQLEFILQGNDQSLIDLQKEKCLRLYEKAAVNLTQNEFDLDIHYKLEYLKRI